MVPLSIVREAIAEGRGTRFIPPRTVTLSGPVTLGDALVRFEGYDTINCRGEIHYLLEKAKFKLDPRRSRGGMAVYRIVSGTVRGLEASVIAVQHHNSKGDFLWEDLYVWDGDLPGQPLRRGDAELRVNRRTGESTLVMLLPGMSGIHHEPGGDSDYDRDATTIEAAGVLTGDGRKAGGSVECHAVNPDPFAEWGGEAHVSGMLTAE